MQERRRFIRWQIDRQAKITLQDQEAGVCCQIKDISYKGAQISSPCHLEKDVYISLSIKLSYDCTLNIEAWVAWYKTIDGYNLYGLYFSKIKDLDKEKIYQFIRSNFPGKVNQQWWKDLSAEKGSEIMQKADVGDRRIFARFSANLPLRFLDPKSDKEGEASTKDISAKGVSFVTKEEIQPNTLLEMWLEISDKGEPLYARGEVVWSKSQGADEYRVGVNLERADLMGMSRVLRTR